MARIALENTETVWNCADGDTIMRSALRAGLGFPYECNVGSCGNCRFDLVEGEIEELRENAPGLSERDRQRGRRLGCQSRPLGDCRVKVRMMPQYESKVRPVHQGARLIETRDLTHDIREFRFALDAPQPFLAGQYALIGLPGVDGDRAYSMCNTGAEGAQWHFQIRRVPEGAATDTLFDRLAPGDAVTLDGPYGMAYLREEAERDIVCVAGGSGLSPMVSVARAAAASERLAGRRIDFIYGGRTARDICGRELLEELPGFGATIHYHAAISDTSDPADGWTGHRGFVHDLAAELIGARLAQCEIYFAGPPAMGEAMQRMLHAQGVPPAQIHFDQFY